MRVRVETARGAGEISQAGEVRSSRIESLRAVAALGVLFGHVYGAAYGYGPVIYASFLHRTLLGGGFGVYLFFALSGYLLFWPFAKRDYGGGAPIDLRRYAINRALRILPLYYVVVIVLLVFQEHGGSATQWSHFLTWSETFSRNTFDTVDGPMWSLVTELHFYVLLPFLACALRRVARGSRARAALGLLALAAVSWVFREVLVPNSLWTYQLPGTFLFFVAGMLVTLVRVSWEERPPRLLRGVIARADVWLLAAVAAWLVVCWRYNRVEIVTISGFLMVGACVLPLRGGPLLRALAWRPLATLGIASYSLYLWHVPLIAWITGTGAAPSYGYAGLLLRAVPLCCAVALLSYAVIEAPFLRLRRCWSPAAPPIDVEPAAAVAAATSP